MNIEVHQCIALSATTGRCHLGLQSSAPWVPPESTPPPCYRELGKPRCRRPQARAPTPPTALPSRTLISHLATPPRGRAAAAARVRRSRLCAARSSRRASAAGSAADSSATPPPSPSASTPVSSKCDSFPCGRPGRRGWAWPPFPPFAACLSRLGSVRF
jgi:hypothetical protein